MPPTAGEAVQPGTVVTAAPAVLFEIAAEDVAEVFADAPDLIRELAETETGRHADYDARREAELAARRGQAETGQKRLIGNLIGQVRNLFAAGSWPLGRLLGGRGNAAFADALLAACALVATADGSVDESERDHVRKVFDDIGLLQHLDEAKGLAQFDALAARLVSDDADAVRALLATVAAMAGERDSARIILSVCRVLSAADGFADADEEARIGLIAEALGMPEAHTGHFDERMFD